MSEDSDSNSEDTPQFPLMQDLVFSESESGQFGIPAEGAGDLINAIGDSKRLKMYALILGIGNAADAIEVSSFAYILTVFNDPRNGEPIVDNPFWSGLLTSGIYSGMLIGGLICGYYGDRIGRQPALVICMSLNFAGSLCCSFTPRMPIALQLYWLMFCRFSAGVGIGGTIPSVFTLISEVSPKVLRGFYVNVVAFCWTIGMLFTAVIARGFLYDAELNENRPDRWPEFAFVAGMPAGVCAILVRFYIHESPRFLAMKKRYKEASVSLLKFAGSAGSSSDLISRIKYYGSIRESNDTSSNESLIDFRSGIWALFQRDLRSSSILVMFIWFLLSFASYGITSWIGELFKDVGFDKDPYAPSLLYAGASIPGNIAATLFVERIGRRKLLTFSFIFGGLSAFVFAFNTKSSFLVVFAACLFQACATSCWSALDTMTGELFPSRIRAFAFGIMACSGRLGAICSNMLNGILFQGASVASILIVTGVSMFSGAFAAAYTKEMTGVELSDR